MQRLLKEIPVWQLSSRPKKEKKINLIKLELDVNNSKKHAFKKSRLHSVSSMIICSQYLMNMDFKNVYFFSLQEK